MDAGATLDTFFLIDHTYAILIVGNRIHWADLLTRALQMGNRIVWACLGTLSALAAFIRVDVRLGISHADRSKRTGVLAALPIHLRRLPPEDAAISNTFRGLCRTECQDDGL